MPAKQIAKSVAAASLCAAMIIAGPAAAQRVIRGYGADEDFQRQAIAADGDRTHQQDYAAAYPQQRASGNYGGGFLEFMMGGPSSAASTPIYLRHEVACD